MTNIAGLVHGGLRLALLAGVFSAAGAPAPPLPEPRTAADYLIHVWSSEDGLPQSSVNCLTQTPDGYLWVGTRSGGLARFDGTRFVVFNPQTTPELRDVEVETLSVDARGTLWLTTGNESITTLAGGKFQLVRDRTAAPRWHPLHLVAEASDGVYLASFHPAVFRVPRQGELNAAELIDLDPPPLAPLPPAFVRDRENALWYITDARQVARLALSGTEGHRARVIPIPSPAQTLARDSAGELWLATAKEFGTITPAGFVPREQDNGPAMSGIRRMVAASDGGLWLWNGRQLWKTLREQPLLSADQFQPAESNQPLRFFADSQGGLWVIEYGAGLWHVSATGGAVLLTRAAGLPSRFITCWWEDNAGNIWVGTKESGLARVRRRQFKQFTTAEGVPGDVAQSVCEDAQGTIWVGTANGGLARKEGNQFVSVPLTPQPDPLIESVTVCPDATDGIWIGTLQGNVFRFSQAEVHRVNHEAALSFPLERLRDHVANAMMQDSQGRVWFCNGSGAYYFHHGRMTMLGHEAGFEENIGVRALAEGPRGTLWLGTEPGDLWRATGSTLVRYHPPPEWPNARVSALLPDAQGVWIGTLGGGLLRFEQGTFTRITTDQGLPDNSITQLLDDDADNLWVATYAGLFRAAKPDLKKLAAGAAGDIAFSMHGRFDGLPAQAYSGWFQPSCWRAQDGRLWFTTVKGLAVVNPRELMVNRRPPPVIIEEIRVNGRAREFPAQAAEETDAATPAPLRIEPGRPFLEFRFTAIDFTAPDKVRCRWRLEGVEKQWRESMHQRVIGYGPLLPGSYRFQVRAANSDGIWNETGASVAFFVLPFFWETWWFRALLIGLICGLLALGVTLLLRHRHRLEMERLERGHAMERERTRIARDMHDEIGAKLARVSFLSELAKSEAPAGLAPGGALDAISKTARELLQSLDRMLWAVNPRHDSLEKLSAYLNRYAAEYFQNTPIQCQLTFPENLPPVSLSAETRHNLFLAFEEVLANVLKHAQATQVSAGMVCHSGQIEITITDNGCGFQTEIRDQAVARNETDRSRGLAGLNHRLRSLGGECRITTAPGQGTRVKLILPLPQHHDD
jgi:ligand-binding sensor domain-containing protein/signal transduction histidine kinase